MPLAKQIAANVELMTKFRAVMGSDDNDRAREMVDEVRNFAQRLDPTIDYVEGATLTVALMTIVGEETT